MSIDKYYCNLRGKYSQTATRQQFERWTTLKKKVEN